MKIDLYERIWMIGVGVMLAAFFASTAVGAISSSMQPPSHVETIDPASVLATSPFKRQGLFQDQQGHLHARFVGLTFAWLPAQLTVPAETPVTFHITALDVVHGFEIVRTNGQSMAIPGYVSQFTTQFSDPGEHLILCNEYCGVGHHTMSAKLIVVPKSQWQPGSLPTETVPAGGNHGHQ
jgi:cytochrome c oxidase subunit 2